MTRAHEASFTLLAGAVLAIGLGWAPAALAGGIPDRLDRFRELARTRLIALDVLGPERADHVLREVYDLLDDEIVESLGTGGLFASEAFLQDRLDAFNEAWGAAALRVMKIGGVLVGVFRLTDGPQGNSVRVYGRFRGESALLGTVQHAGRPVLHPWSTAAAGVAGGPAQFVVVWEGARSARGSATLRVQLVRVVGEALRTVWSTVELLGDEPRVRGYAVKYPDIALRYELHYAGWIPGCPNQTEQEEVYRYSVPQQTFVLARRQTVSPAHREFNAFVERLLAAARRGDAAALQELVPDPAVRARLPADLERDAACDAPDPSAPDIVSVAAAAGSERRPWTLSFRRRGATWRLTAAEPVGG